MVYWIAYVGAKCLSFLFFPRTVSGREHIPISGPFLLASNHVSYLDPVILGISSGRRLNYMAKDALFSNKVLGWILLQLGAFPIKRNSGDTGALKECFRRLKKGGPLLLFPEGTRHGAAGEKKALAGVGFLAFKAGVPVVPVFITGSEKVLPPGARFFTRSAVRVRYGKPVVFNQAVDYEEIAGHVMKSILALSKHS